MGSSKPTTQKTTSTRELPGWIQPTVQDYVSRANALSQQDVPIYEGPRVAGMTPQHMSALSGAEGMYGRLGAGMDTLQSTASGEMLNTNPYIDATFNRAADAVQSRMLNATGGALSNAGVQQAYARDLNDLATNIYGGNYARERQNQLTAAGQLPGYASSATQFGMGIGDAYRAQEQAMIDANREQFAEEANAPYQQLQTLGGALSGVLPFAGGTTTGVAPGPSKPSLFGTLLGAGMTGLGMMGGPAGGALGGLFSTPFNSSAASYGGPWQSNPYMQPWT